MNCSDTASWLNEKRAEKCVQNLKRHGFDAVYFPDLDSARSFILEKVAIYDTFGFGGSDTTRRLNIIEPLKQSKKTVFDHWEENLSAEESLAVRRNQLKCDCFFCSANAVSITGEIVNVDGVGNRTSAMAFGPRHVVIVAGVNKLASDLTAAIERVKEIAAPMRAKSLNMKTPCAETGVCNDCSVPQRICRITSILHRKPMLTDVSVVIVNEKLGF
ncbi:MAG: lactate utilization protein [Deltaproteobacteria bacterium]